MNFEDFYIEPLYYDFEGMMQPTVPMPPSMPMPPPSSPSRPYRPGRPVEPFQPPMQPFQPPMQPFQPPMQPVQPIEPEEPPVVRSRDYIQGYLRSIIGRYVKVEFILGTNMLMDREGTLLEVGIDHIVLREPETDDHVVADLYSIKFVRVFY
ncbi:hypothetical protein Curi_c09630 [Gottschalkia acidurici 9a]|uniref:Spore coat protein GerQ n=1 Tax=Gottschalkia acidurici (strain ATCC 7906 / DSM 604 / BCRC 14475 / CIP 104303 / KCTC 5404 / NCIMB 10678 / 9a) TaxID=1128398 RepID=K0AXS2_GOTA9|nr:hypothetical protein [Gottschalkia acidurici]AFS77979.1 hypothetical protein Curi_c09630 [Gottschalkia acidurici 9a]